MVTGVDPATVDGDAENVADEAQAATVTATGTLAAAWPLDSGTTAPPAGAVLDSVTVPCEVPPPVTLVGFIVTACNVAAGGGIVGARCGRTALAITAALGAPA